VTRLNEETKALSGVARTHDPKRVFTKNAKGRAFNVDSDLKYRLIADIDAFLFELSACTEQIRKLFQLLHAYACSPILDKDLTATLQNVLTRRGVASDWFPALDRNRNFFAHEGTAYLAIDISNDAAWDLLIMKENLFKFDQPKKFVRFAEL